MEIFLSWESPPGQTWIPPQHPRGMAAHSLQEIPELLRTGSCWPSRHGRDPDSQPCPPGQTSLGPAATGGGGGEKPLAHPARPRPCGSHLRHPPGDHAAPRVHLRGPGKWPAPSGHQGRTCRKPYLQPPLPLSGSSMLSSADTDSYWHWHTTQTPASPGGGGSARGLRPPEDAPQDSQRRLPPSLHPDPSPPGSPSISDPL